MNKQEKREKVLHGFNQRSEPCGSMMYSNHNDPSQTIASSGSVPTLCATVVSILKNKPVNPATLAEFSLACGCRTYYSGTTWDFHKQVAMYYGFRKFVQTCYFESVKECLDDGGLAICAVRPGYWSKVGNSILLYDYDSTYIYAVGPEFRKGRQTAEAFKKDMKMCFCYYPDETTANCATDKFGGLTC